MKEGFHKCPYEHTLSVKIRDKGKLLIVYLYVDDLIFTRNDDVMFKEFKKSMMVEFEMSDLGMLHYFLGIEVVQSAKWDLYFSKEVCARCFRQVSDEGLQSYKHSKAKQRS